MSLEWLADHRRALARTGVLRQVLRVELLEQTLDDAGIPLPQGQAMEGLLQRFWQRQQIPPPQCQAWLDQRQLTEGDLQRMVSRPLRWREWCREQFHEKREALFLRHKNKLDVATAFLLRLEDPGLARELYLQLEDGEASFDELARRHCCDHPQRQGGQWGPKPLSELPPPLAELIRTSAVGQLRGPEQLGPADWVVLRVEAFQGSRADDPAIQERLMQLEGEAWLADRIEAWLKRPPASDRSV